MFFCQITTFIKVHVAFVFGLQTLWLIDFTKIFQLKGLKHKNKGRTNFYECCDLTKKVYLLIIFEIEMKYKLQAKEVREVMLVLIATLIGFPSHVPPMGSGQLFKPMGQRV